MSKKQCKGQDLNQLSREEKDIKKFLNVCRQEWRRIHHSEMKKPGRPSQKDRIWAACDKAANEGKLRLPLTQGKVIDKIQNDVGIISEKTLLAHVKTWIAKQIWVTTSSKISKGQLHWLQKNEPKLLHFLTNQWPDIIKKGREFFETERQNIIEKLKFKFPL